MPSVTRALSLAAAAVVMTACTVGPDYVRPSMPLPAAYKEAGDWTLANPRDHLPRGAWWEAFGDPGLDALQRRLNLGNQDVQGAAARLRASQAIIQQTRAGLLPSLSGDASLTRSQGRASSGGTTTVSRAPVTTGAVSLSLPWEIDLWGKVARQVEAGRASAEAAAAELESTRLSAQASLAQNYFLLRVAEAQQRLLDRTVTAYAKAAEITRNRFEAGVVAKADVVQAEVQLRTTQAQAIDLGKDRAQLAHAIAVLTGRSPAELDLDPGELPSQLPKVPPGIPTTLLERRPDIAQAEREVAAANARIGVARAAYFPALSLSASGGYEGSQMSRLLSVGNRYWAIGPSIAAPIFDAGLRRAQTAEAIANYDATVAAYRQSVLTGLQEVEDNLATLRILEAEADAQDAAVAASRRSVELALNQYKAGTVNYLSVVTAQTAQLSSERTALEIRGRRLTASVTLIKSLGGGWQADQTPTDG